jgi:hypothetical protein
VSPAIAMRAWGALDVVGVGSLVGVRVGVGSIDVAEGLGFAEGGSSELGQNA